MHKLCANVWWAGQIYTRYLLKKQSVNAQLMYLCYDCIYDTYVYTENIPCCAIHVLHMCLHLWFLPWVGNCLHNPYHCLRVQRVCQRPQILWVCPKGGNVWMFMSKAFVCVLREALCSWPCLKSLSACPTGGSLLMAMSQIFVCMSWAIAMQGTLAAHGYVYNYRLRVLRAAFFLWPCLKSSSDQCVHTHAYKHTHTHTHTHPHIYVHRLTIRSAHARHHFCKEAMEWKG